MRVFEFFGTSQKQESVNFMNSQHVFGFSDNSCNGNCSVLEESFINLVLAYLYRYRSVGNYLVFYRSRVLRIRNVVLRLLLLRIKHTFYSSVLMFYRYSCTTMDLSCVSFQSFQIQKIFRQIPLCETIQFCDLLEYANFSHISHHNKFCDKKDFQVTLCAPKFFILLQFITFPKISIHNTFITFPKISIHNSLQ
jgi:hypothetical protein